MKIKKIVWIVLSVIFLTSFIDRTENSGLASNPKSPEIMRLELFVGKWITAGSAVDDAASKPLEIQSTDIRSFRDD